jgi:hypothetical protein
MAGKQTQTSSQCISKVRDSKIKVHDPGTGKSAILLNPDRTQVRRIRMDGCFAPVGATAADFVVSMPKAVDVIVELKGKNVDHAVEQIDSTWEFWLNHAEREPNQLIGAWIVCSECPKFNSKVARYRESLRARGSILLVSTHNGEERAFSEFVPKHR